uniref:Basic 7S globulin n=2 Tax=Cajanus cajan TaxID=3821 RepID=A0A151TW66_CAJCA|nr:Basic 7S globulin [Cajanus cajan]
MSMFHDMAFTPLTITTQGEYNVRVDSIRIDSQLLTPPTQTKPWSSEDTEAGGTTISTSTPYMVLQSFIFEAFTQRFAHQIPEEVKVEPVAPFTLCCDANKASKFPKVEFVMDRPNGPAFKFSGEDLMVQVRPGVKCLAVINGGLQSKAPITIGARQLEEKLLVFDLARSRLGFTTKPALNFKCANLFNFPNA